MKEKTDKERKKIGNLLSNRRLLYWVVGILGILILIGLYVWLGRDASYPIQEAISAPPPLPS